MKCINCNKELPDTAKFCNECGTKIEDNKVEIDVIRIGSILGFAISFPVFVDDVEIGSLKNNSSLTCKVPFGKHKVVFKAVEKDTVEEIDIPSTATKVEIYVKPKMGFVAATVKVEDIKII